VADELVRRMAAERLSAKVIRMMRPDSVFLAAVKAVLPEIKFVPVKLPPAEIGNCKFVRPASDPRPSFATVRAGWDWSQEVSA
jgi:hypothetical protein